MDRMLWALTPMSYVGKKKQGGHALLQLLGMGSLAGQLGEWLCRAVLQQLVPRVCGTPVAASRVQLSDSRHLAYEELRAQGEHGIGSSSRTGSQILPQQPLR